LIIDTSAIIAILFAEPDAPVMAGAIADAPTRMMSAGNWLEAAMVSRRAAETTFRDVLDDLIARAKIEIVPFTTQQAWLARNAFAQYGKGIHPAALNYGDCIAYALAKATGEPLLFKGDDFSRTDIRSALAG
jgi:ribonuclease VapC